MTELVLVKYLQPASSKGFGQFKLDGLYDHPARWVYCICWFDDNTIQGVGREGGFPLDENLRCENYLGEYRAEVVGRNLPHGMMDDADYYELAQEDN